MQQKLLIYSELMNGKLPEGNFRSLERDYSLPVGNLTLEKGYT